MRVIFLWMYYIWPALLRFLPPSYLLHIALYTLTRFLFPSLPPHHYLRFPRSATSVPALRSEGKHAFILYT